MLAAIYGLQAMIFIFRMRWDMIAWMVCEYPIFPRQRALLTVLQSLYMCHSRILVLVAVVLFLENGRLQLGFYQAG